MLNCELIFEYNIKQKKGLTQDYKKVYQKEGILIFIKYLIRLVIGKNIWGCSQFKLISENVFYQERMIKDWWCHKNSI